MRKEPEVMPPAQITHRKLALIEQKRKYELITPLYGGGVGGDDVTANNADPISVVRATEIRGHLRFWWRAVRGGQDEGEPDIKTREDEIWGKAYEKGDTGIPPDQIVQIVVDISQEGTPIKPFRMRGRTPVAINDIPGYAAFPLQPDQNERKKANPLIADVRKGVQFLLTISYPERLSEEINAALWAWETFGGLGARTRRGFGALHLLEIDGVPYQLLPTSLDVQRWIQDEAHKHIKVGSFPPDLPHLNRNMQFAITPAVENPMRAWNNLVRKLQEFRLQKDENNRSAWPEADAIRKIAGKTTKNEPPSPQTFPRAAFGLPIIFHFTGNDAPENHTLNEADTRSQERESKERFASPLILRPFLCRDNRAVGLALLLEGSRVNLEHLILQDEDKISHAEKGTLTLDEARLLTKKIPALREETDVLQAFMKLLKGV
jgi:CRISPR-associated protein Cmr1